MFLILCEQEAFHFHFTLGLPNYIALFGCWIILHEAGTMLEVAQWLE